MELKVKYDNQEIIAWINGIVQFGGDDDITYPTNYEDFFEQYKEEEKLLNSMLYFDICYKFGDLPYYGKELSIYRLIHEDIEDEFFYILIYNDDLEDKVFYQIFDDDIKKIIKLLPVKYSADVDIELIK